MCQTDTSHTIAPKSSTPFSWSIARQRLAEQKLQTQFQTLFKKGLEPSENSGKYLIYRCDEACLTDYKYVHGVTAGFIWAMITERKFKMAVQGLGSRSVFNLYEPNEYSWMFQNVSDIVAKKSKPIIKEVHSSYHDSEIFVFLREILESNLDYPEPLLYLSENHDWILYLRRNPLVTEKLPWICSTPDTDIIRLIHYGLFTLSKDLKSKIHKALSKQMGNKKLFCYYGNDLLSLANTASVLELTDKFGEDYNVFIHANKSEKLVLSNNLEERIVTLDNLKASESRDPFGFVTALEVGSLCDVLVTTDNALGVLAAILRPTTNNLFCINHESHVYSCTREGITGAFRNNLPFKPNLRYIKLYRPTSSFSKFILS